MDTTSYTGPERRTQERRLQTKRSLWWRRVFVTWAILFSLAVMYSIRDSRESANDADQTAKSIKVLTKENAHRIADLERSKAQLSALQATNCGLEIFLLTARKARWEAYEHDHSPDDLRAVIGYEQLVRPFVQRADATGRCPIPKRLAITGRPIVGGH